MDIASIQAELRAIRRRVYRRRYIGFGPMPHYAKLNGLLRVFIPGAPVVETGTHRGDSTRHFASHGFPVHTIEVSETLAAAAFPGLRRKGVQCYLGDSGRVLPQALDAVVASGARAINLWLDGHWSGGITSTAPDYETPIVPELDCVGARLSRFDQVCVAVDDFRCFGNDPTYPSKQFLIDWAAQHRLRAYFLADIFVASTETYSDL